MKQIYFFQIACLNKDNFVIIFFKTYFFLVGFNDQNQYIIDDQESIVNISTKIFSVYRELSI